MKLDGLLRCSNELGRRKRTSRLWLDKTAQRIAIEGISLVRVAIPLPVQIADDLCGNDDAECAQVVLLHDARIDDFIIRTKREFCRAREFPVAQYLDLVFARILPHGK